ncbi:ATP-dependent helicase [Schaalia hyovaginalis]|nr:ATP-dependent helicase [Schaalia hyovaginalis]
MARWVAGQFPNLLVDEMQDTNPIQWDILLPLVPFVSLYCVGDDAQSIYGFRGASFDNIHHFQEVVSGSEVIGLTLHYRSTQKILNLSNWLLAASPSTTISASFLTLVEGSYRRFTTLPTRTNLQHGSVTRSSRSTTTEKTYNRT